MILEIWTDGSSLGNPGPGGWGVVMKFNGKTKEMSGSNPDTTNNRMELTAIIEALEVVGKTNHPIQLWSDSKYCVDAINKGWVFNWAKKPGFAGKKKSFLRFNCKNCDSCGREKNYNSFLSYFVYNCRIRFE